MPNDYTNTDLSDDDRKFLEGFDEKVLRLSATSCTHTFDKPDDCWRRDPHGFELEVESETFYRVFLNDLQPFFPRNSASIKQLLSIVRCTEPQSDHLRGCANLSTRHWQKFLALQPLVLEQPEEVIHINKTLERFAQAGLISDWTQADVMPLSSDWKEFVVIALTNGVNYLLDAIFSFWRCAHELLSGHRRHFFSRHHYWYQDCDIQWYMDRYGSDRRSPSLAQLSDDHITPFCVGLPKLGKIAPKSWVRKQDSCGGTIIYSDRLLPVNFKLPKYGINDAMAVATQEESFPEGHMRLIRELEDLAYDKAMNFATSVVRDLEDLDAKAKRLAASELTDLYNDHGWVQHQRFFESNSIYHFVEPPLTRNEFSHHLTLKSISSVDLAHLRFQYEFSPFWEVSVTTNDGTLFSDTEVHLHRHLEWNFRWNGQV